MTYRTMPAPVRRLVARVSARARRVARGRDGGFILLESIVAIACITVIMGAVGAEYVTGLATTNHARLQTVAVQIAASNMDQIQALHPSDLVTGRGSSQVDAERTTVSQFTAVGPTSYEAYDSTASASSPGTTFGTGAVTTTVGPMTYTVYRYFECTLPATNGSCVTAPSQTSLTSNNVRAIVLVTWPQRGCPSVTTTTTSGPTCSYSTSSIINADDDLTFDLNQPLPAAPIVNNPSPLTDAIGDAVFYQLTTQSGTGVSPFTWSITSGALPAGLTMSSSGLITGTVAGPVTTATATVTVTDAFIRTASATLTWNVESAFAEAAVANQSNFVGASVSLSMSASGGGGSGYTFSDPNSTLPPGLTVSSAGVISGTLTRSSSVTYPATYSVTITATDPQSCTACVTNPRTTTTNFRWTVSNPPLALGSPGTQRWTSGTAATLQMAASGGDGTFVWSASGLPSNLSISSTGLISGTPGATGTGTATITVSDPTASGVSPITVTFPWTVFAQPTVTAPANQTDSQGGTVNVALTTSCPDGPCTYSASSLPSGLSISSTGVISGTIPANATTGTSSVVVTVTDSAGATASSQSFTWTVLSAPSFASTSLGSLAFLETVNGNVAVPYNCPAASCTITLTGTMPGLGLSATANPTGNQTATTLTVTATSGTVYIGGTVQTSAVTGTATNATYTPALTILATPDNAPGSNGSSGTWLAFNAPATFAASENNVGITSATKRSSGTFDNVAGTSSGAHDSFSYENLKLTSSNATVTAGQQITVNTDTYNLPATAGSGSPDNIAANQQVISYAGSGVSNIGFLVGANGASSNAQVTVIYTDGTYATPTLGSASTPSATTVPDWLTASTSSALKSVENVQAAGSSTSSTSSTPVYMYERQVAVDPSKRVAYIVLPTATSSTSYLHVFGISQPPLASSFNNFGIAALANRSTGNLDGYNYSLDYDAIVAAGGPSAGATVSVGGVNYQWPGSAGTGVSDNTTAGGQVIPFTATGSSTLGFLVTGVNGAPAATGGVITFTDGSTQTLSISAGDWCSQSGYSVAFSASPRYTSNGTDNQTTKIDYVNVTVPSSKMIKSITLPSTVSGSTTKLHIFAIGYGS